MQVPGYSWYGNNRNRIHKNAKAVSGGVGFLIKNEILTEFDIMVLQQSYEGIFWLKLTHKTESLVLLPCVCYLPPENSSRRVDVNDFFDNLLSDFYQFQNMGLVFISGDFNSRCGELEDFIAGVDNIVPRHVIDFKSNYYGERFIDFLINANLCMLNGRYNDCLNNFTSVSTKGSSVVDYCIVPHNDLNCFSDFGVTSTLELINAVPELCQVASAGLPDHSLLSWKITANVVEGSSSTTNVGESEAFYDKFNLNEIPETFLGNNESWKFLNETIDRLEGGRRDQQDIDGIYNSWCDFVKTNMYSSVPHRRQYFGRKAKKHKPEKPWWSTVLSDLWSKLCQAERKWLKSTGQQEKVRLKAEYVGIRKSFDREVQRAKRLYWYSLQSELENECNIDQTRFWKSIGKIGVNSSKADIIPMEVITQDGSTTTCTIDVLNKWKNDFSSLLNCNIKSPAREVTANDKPVSDQDVSFFEQNISILEVKKAVNGAKRGKACGVDQIPSEVLQNDVSICFLHVLFNVCFDKGLVPALWGQCVIKPIPKSSSNDPRDPLSYRGIALASSIYKVYCTVINDRLTKWAESRDVITDEQNGFRKKRSTIDHISSLTSIIDTRKKLKLSTFCAFIDFRKAYDSINRAKLWQRLSELGVSGKLYRSIQSLYASVTSCVRVNSLHTEWFDVNCGLRQGCILSPILFNLYINDLALYLKSLDKGITCGEDKVCILLYADDIVLMAETEQDLQFLLNALNNWCASNDMVINVKKSNVIHFRTPSKQKTNFLFKCGNDTLEMVDRYVYLGLLLTEHLDFEKTVKYVAQSASRALGL